MNESFILHVCGEGKGEIKTNSAYTDDHHFFVLPWSCIFHVSPFFQEKNNPCFLAVCHFAWSMASTVLTDTVRQLSDYSSQPLKTFLITSCLSRAEDSSNLKRLTRLGAAT